MGSKDVKRAVGIDIGTTNSSIGIFLNGKASVIHDEKGSGRMPSCVAFNETGYLIGDAASRQAYRNHGNTIFGAKRFLSEDLKEFDLTVQANRKLWPFEVISDNGKAKFEIDYQEYKVYVSPEEIITKIVKKLKENAEACLKEKVTDAVITVPVHFNYTQRRLIKKAGVNAGLNVLRLLHETSAVAICHGIDKIYSMDYIMVFDIGGGTTKVSVLCVEGGIFDIISIESNSQVGGEEFTNTMVCYFIEEIKKKYKKDISNDKKAVNRLRIACNNAKHLLSSCTRAYIELYALFEDDFFSSITRECFEEINLHLFEKAIETAGKALQSAEGISSSDIKEIVLVGGSTKIPKIQQMLRTQFNGIELYSAVDTAVASGAAYQAAILTGQHNKVIEDVLLLDVLPFSLGIQTDGGVMKTICKKNMAFPIKRMEMFTTIVDKQSLVQLKIYEGENAMVKDNHFLGGFYLFGLQSATHGEPQIEIVVDIDANGDMMVTAEEKSTGNSRKINISYDKVVDLAKDFEKIHLKEDVACALIPHCIVLTEDLTT